MSVKVTVEGSSAIEAAQMLELIASPEVHADESYQGPEVHVDGTALKAMVMEVIKGRAGQPQVKCDHDALELFSDDKHENEACLFNYTFYSPRNIYKGIGPLRIEVRGHICRLCNELFITQEVEELYVDENRKE